MNYFMLYCCSSVLTRHAAEVNSLRRTALGATLQVFLRVSRKHVSFLHRTV